MSRPFPARRTRAAAPLALAALAFACTGPPMPGPASPERPAARAAASGGGGSPAVAERRVPRSFPANPAEPRLANLRMLTDGGENAEAYFSADGRRLIFQATRPGESECDQIYVMDLEAGEARRVSTGRGRTTCAYFFPAGDRILYSSTHHAGDACPPRPDYSRGYVWALYDYDIYTAAPDGSDVRRLTSTPGYDAEATISPDGKTIVFTSVRDGDLDIYAMDADGGNVRRLTHEEGYDGGPFFSADGSKIVYRARHPEDPEELADYRSLRDQGLVRPGVLDIFIMDADGSNKTRLTDNGAANFAPFFHPDGRRVIFTSNLHDPDGRNFDLYLIGLDGGGLERVTVHGDFDGFPMFSPDGRTLVFASNRGAAEPGETNVFIADWVEDLPAKAAAPAEPAAPPEGVEPAAPPLPRGPAPPSVERPHQGEACPDPAALSGGTTAPMGVVRYLAADALEGRLAGSPGERCAADFVASRFRALGFAPAGDSAGWFQAVPLASAVNPHAPAGIGRNVLALLEGADPARRGEVIVIGAHLDHLGFGPFGSLAPDERAVHNGADDNASGVAALLEAAERLAAGPRPARSILFIAFTGEEFGLLGSAHYAAHPTVPLERTRAMINLDMVGRLGDGPLLVYGTGTAEEWEALLREAAAGLDVRMAFKPDGYGPSDHTSFYAKDVPVLHFFTNVHPDYHRPSDDWPKVDSAGLETVARIVARIARDVADRPEPLALVRGAGTPPAPAGSNEASPGYGSYLGSIPDFTPVERGVRLTGVRAGSPAEMAGIRAGDVIVRMGSIEVKDIYGLTEALRTYPPGERVPVTVLRDGAEVTVEVVLGERGGE